MCKLRVAAVRAIGSLKAKNLEPQMKKLLLSQAPNEVRTEAVRILGRARLWLHSSLGSGTVWPVAVRIAQRGVGCH